MFPVAVLGDSVGSTLVAFSLSGAKLMESDPKNNLHEIYFSLTVRWGLLMLQISG
jgi:hypothetical protein